MSAPLDSQDGERQTPSWWALAIGIALAGIPLVHFGALSGEDGGHHQAFKQASNQESEHSSATGPHSDHGPHHGGQLGMVGDLHVEMVERDGTIEIHLSDAERRPLPPTGGSITFDTGTSQPLAPFSTFLLAPIDKQAEEVTVLVEVDEATGETAEISFLMGH